MPYRGRFAPSPTGDLHFGSLVAALASFLRARQLGGQWLLRVEDIDPPREVAGSTRGILATLAALGLRSDQPPLYQSQRGHAYAAALQALREAGHAFPCWCSRAALTEAGPHRDGRCLHAPSRRPPAWRLRAPDVEIAFEDGLQGGFRQNLREAVGDFVLLRGDGLWSYQLACVVDDAQQGISEVVRGCDLLDSTPRQIYLQSLLGLPTPAYLHLPLATDRAGSKLSKSAGTPAVDPHDPCATLAAALRFLGQPVADEPKLSRMLQSAARQFDLAGLRGKSAAAVY